MSKKKEKYNLGDYVKYYQSYCKTNDRIEYKDPAEGFVNAIEHKLDENGDETIRYSISLYIGGGGYIVREEAIVEKLTTPKWVSRCEYLRHTLLCNNVRIENLKANNARILKELSKLEKRTRK